MSRQISAQRLWSGRLLLAGFLLVFLAPIIWLLSVAYKPAREIFSFPPTLTFSPTLANFETILSIFDMPEILWNSVVIAGGSTLISLALGIPAGYALARSGWRFATALAYFFLVVRMVPPTATLIPFYLMMRDFGLLGGYWAVVLINAVFNAAFVVWMMYTYFRSLPKELEEAALSDGCTQIGAFLRVALPLVVPGIIASAMFCIILAWNNFLFPAFLTTADTKPLSVAILSTYGTKDITWGTMGAFAHFLVVPMIAMTLLLNRHFVNGWTRGLN
jgi:multiple sugar transport system permease protein